MKHKFTMPDVTAEATYVRNNYLGFRVANVYDHGSRVYSIKLSKSGGGTGEAEKAMLLVESGTRFHITEFTRAKDSMPNNFALKLRKHLRTKRITSFQQLGADRVIDIAFGGGPACNHLIVELYGQGNVILTDNQFRILSALRTHRNDRKGVNISPRNFYPMWLCKTYERIPKERIVDALTSQPPGANEEGKEKSAKKRQRADGAISSVVPYGQTYSVHFLSQAGVPASAGLPLSLDTANAVADHVREFECWLESVSVDRMAPAGHIYIGTAHHAEGHKVYEEFTPYSLSQFKERDVKSFNTFNAAVDDYFSKIEGQRQEERRAKAENEALNRLNRVREDVNKRAENLFEEAVKEEFAARLLEENLDSVSEAIQSMNALIAGGMSWSDVEQVVQDEKRQGNYIASLIERLDLESNRIFLRLECEKGSDDDSEDAGEAQEGAGTRGGHFAEASDTTNAVVEVDLSLSAYANASRHFESRKRHEVKRERTVAQSEAAYEAAEKKAKKQIESARSKAQVKVARKTHWFEKFHWFISSEGFLVLAGRDAQQNDMLVKRHLKEGDAYVHADVQGAASCVVKNRRDKSLPIPPVTLQQAGQFCICHSQAWNNNIVTSAWWVYPSQVSKTAPSGEYLQTGAFMVRGKKNFLPPSQLMMGFTFVFRLDDASVGNHLNERFIRGEANEEEKVEEEHQALGYLETQREQSSHSSLSQGGSTLQHYLAEPEEEWSHAGQPGKGGRSRQSGSANGGQSKASKEQKPAQPTSKSQKKEQRRQEKRQKKLGAAQGQTQKSTSELPLPGDQMQGGKKGTPKSLEEVEPEETVFSLHALRDTLPTQYLSETGDESDNQGHDEGERDERQGKGDDEKGHQHEPEAEAEGERARADEQDGRSKSGTDNEENELDEERPGAEEEEEGERSKSSTENEVGEGEVAPPKPPPPPMPPDYDATQGEESNHGDEAEGHKEQEAEDEDEAQEVHKVLQEENIPEVEESEWERLEDIDAVTGQPRVDDVLLYALPMCAPYGAVQNHKYKAKLNPGTMKKGKASKQALDLFLRFGQPTERERELLKSIQDTELANAMLGNVRVSSPGMQQVQAQQKKAKKQKKKGK